MNNDKKYRLYFVTFLIFLMSGAGTSAQNISKSYTIILPVNIAKVNNKTTITSYKATSTDMKYVSLKKGIGERVSNDSESEPDITYAINVPEPGKYRIFADVVREEEIKPGMTVETRLVKLQIDNQRITRRIVSNLHEYSGHDLGTFNLEAGQELKIWLPEKIFFEAIRIKHIFRKRFLPGQ